MDIFKRLRPKEGVTLLAVKVPDGAHNFHVFNDEKPYLSLFQFSPMLTDRIYLPGCNWQLLGTPEQIPEEVWGGIVENKLSDERTGGLVYLNYNLKSKPDQWFSTATESAMSFLEANEVYSVNPWAIAYQFDQYRAWQFNEAQANTGTWVILMKQND